LGNAIATVDKDLAQIEEIKKGVGDLAIRMSAIKIKTQDDYNQAVEIGKEGAKSVKALTLAVSLAKDPYQKKVDKIKAAGKAIIDAIETASDDLRDRCRKFIRDEDAKKQKEIADLAEKRRKAEQEIAEANTEKEQEKAVAKVEKIETKIETKVAEKVENSTTYRKVEVVDANLVPREYMSVDMTKLNAIRGKVGTPYPEVPGVKFFDEKSVKF
jgi:hypothetical protein